MEKLQALLLGSAHPPPWAALVCLRALGPEPEASVRPQCVPLLGRAAAWARGRRDLEPQLACPRFCGSGPNTAEGQSLGWQSPTCASVTAWSLGHSRPRLTSGVPSGVVRFGFQAGGDFCSKGHSPWSRAWALVCEVGGPCWRAAVSQWLARLPWSPPPAGWPRAGSDDLWVTGPLTFALVWHRKQRVDPRTCQCDLPRLALGLPTPF